MNVMQFLNPILNPSNKKILFTSLIIVGILILLTTLLLGSSQKKEEIFNNIQVSPKDGENSADYTGDISISFQKQVNIKQFNFYLSPKTEGNFTQPDQFTLVFIPASYLQQATNYTATIISGNASHSWTFKTEDGSGEEGFTNEEAQQFMKIREAADKAFQERKKRFPFLNLLPYRTDHFIIEITSSDVIVITVYGVAPKIIAQYQQEARDWLSNNGNNPNALNIQYKTLQQ